MTPMNLERALEVAIQCTSWWDWSKPPFDGALPHSEVAQAAAVLRAFMEKGLPFKSEGAGFIIHDGPDLTEALARLKALEDICRVDKMPNLADEIAAIRKAMGASDAAPTPEPKP